MLPVVPCAIHWELAVCLLGGSVYAYQILNLSPSASLVIVSLCSMSASLSC